MQPFFVTQFCEVIREICDCTASSTPTALQHHNKSIIAIFQIHFTCSSSHYTLPRNFYSKQMLTFFMHKVISCSLIKMKLLLRDDRTIFIYYCTHRHTPRTTTCASWYLCCVVAEQNCKRTVRRLKFLLNDRKMNDV